MTEQTDRRKRSILWNYFEKDPISLTGKCKFCQKILSYRSTICNLNAHLKQVHNFMTYKGHTQATKIMNIINKNNEESVPEWDEKCSPDAPTAIDSETEHLEFTDEENIKEVAVPAETTRNNKSLIWDYFDKDNEYCKAVCHLCLNTLSYKTTTNNLRVHLRNKHIEAYKECMSRCGYKQAEKNGSRSNSETNYVDQNNEESVHERAENFNPDSETEHLEFTDEENIKEVAVPAETTRNNKSLIWDYFDNDNEYCKAVCHLCLNTLSYKTTTNNLRVHLRNKHIEAYKECMSRCGYKQAEKNGSRSNSETNYVDQNNEESVHEPAENFNPDSETELLEFTDEEYLEEVAVPDGRTEKQSIIWAYFDKGICGKAVCNFCQNTLSYKSTTNNLKTHLKRKHIEAYKECMSRYDYYQQSKHQTKSDEEYLGRTGKQSLMWAYFKKDNCGMAVCNFCQNTISYKSTTNNLKTHLRRKHIEAYKECMSRYGYYQQSTHQTKSKSGRATSSVSNDEESIYEQVINILKPKTEGQELSNDDEQIVEIVVAETEESDPLSSQCQPDIIQASGLKSFRVRLKDLKETNKSSKTYKSNNKVTMKKKINNEETTQKEEIMHELDIQIKKEELRIKRELFKQNVLKTRLMLLELRNKRKKIRRYNTEKHKKNKKRRV